ncbi:MAG: DegT/DnrJ/EryC1/StrS family aminotransferase, partial [Gemmatimonadaceae bacterium]
QIARLYRAGLEGIDDFVLPPGPDNDPDHYDVYQNYEVESGRRDELRAALEKDGIRTIIQWAGKPVHHFDGLGLPKFDLPFTDNLFTRCFLLPMNTSLTDDEVLHICERVRKFHAG